jgi:hypothetical protein
VGYRVLDEQARSMLFEVINARYLKGSIILVFPSFPVA